jgi:hypothetical protein
MGHLYYGTSTDAIRIPDRLLAHLKVVATTKLRRSESFTLSWTHVDGTPGRSTLWLQPAIPLRFVFNSAEPESLNAAALKGMADMANSSTGLVVDLSAEIPSAPAHTRTPERRAAASAPRRSALSVAA